MKKSKLLRYSLIIVLLINLLSFTVIEYKKVEHLHITSFSIGGVKAKPHWNIPYLTRVENFKNKFYPSGNNNSDAALGLDFLEKKILTNEKFFDSNLKVLMKRFVRVKESNELKDKFDNTMKSLKDIEEHLSTVTSVVKKNQILKGIGQIMKQITKKTNNPRGNLQTSNYGLLDEINLLEKTLRNNFKITIGDEDIPLRFEKMHPNGINGEWDLLTRTSNNRRVYIDNKHGKFELEKMEKKVSEMVKHSKKQSGNPIYIIYNSKLELTDGSLSQSIKKIYETLRNHGIKKEQAKNFLFVGKNNIAAIPDDATLNDIFK